MGGHHEVKLPKVPDWRVYKVEDVPELMAVKKALASHGLRDPWLRNEVWRYQTYLHPKNRFAAQFKGIPLKGMKYGLGLAILTSVVEFTLTRNSHGHGHEGEHH